MRLLLEELHEGEYHGHQSKGPVLHLQSLLGIGPQCGIEAGKPPHSDV
jgi:hypothetical protein